MFLNWREMRVDVDPRAEPEILASAADLSQIGNGSVAAIWTAHCIEHLFAHDVTRALAEFRRVLSDDGFACIIVPDMQTVARYVADDKMHEVLYMSPIGPITAHDIMFGHGESLSRGHIAMAHRCGFTPTLMLQRLKDAGFAEIILRRRSNLELAAVVRNSASEPNERDALLMALEI
jgi:ubiquinone/menaquinone biosynthesis C-methylase UbiE